MYYVQRGSIPRQRHTQHRAPDGSLYAEELFGVEGFTRPELAALPPDPADPDPPDRAGHPDPARGRRRRLAPPSPDEDRRARAARRHRHRPDPAVLQPRRRVRAWSARPGRCPTACSTATAWPTRCCSSTRAAARATRSSGRSRYGPGDYLVLPIGTTWRLEPDAGSPQRILYLEAPSEIEPPKRYRNDYGQLLEHSPYSQRDLHAPDAGPSRATRRASSSSTCRSTDRITAYHYRHHPFDVVGWDGYLWPFRFNIGDFQPITGRVHQPPPVHQTFQARNFVVCSFVPRKFDYHPLAIPAPYNHSNINSDEVIYYVAGNFMSRRGVEISSFTLHPAGIPHGPHPGTVEASIGKEAHGGAGGHGRHVPSAACDAGRDGPRRPGYPYSWLPAEDAAAEARELSERGPEAFPD